MNAKESHERQAAKAVPFPHQKLKTPHRNLHTSCRLETHLLQDLGESVSTPLAQKEDIEYTR